MAQREFVTHPLVLRRLEVISAQDITARMRRVTLGGDQLRAFERDGLRHPAFRAPGFDDHVKALFAEDGDVESVLPVQLAEGIEWTPAPTRQGRDYTPRRIRDGEVDFDFVLHGDGPAVAWARSAEPGDALWVVGPKSSIVLPEQLDWILLVGDETALPAIGRFLEDRPVDAPAHVVVALGDPSARQELALRPQDTISWLLAEPTDRDALEKAVRAALPDDGDGFVWAAAESRTLLPVRRLLSHERRMPKNRMNVTGYWHAEDELGAPQHPEVPAPLAWFAVRAALRSGLLDHLADHPGATVAQAAAAADLSAAELRALIPTLVHHGMVESDGGLLRLGAPGDELLADEHQREGFDGHEAELLLALERLAEGSDGTPWSRRTGSTLAAAARTDAGVSDELREHAEVLQFIAHALLHDPVWSGAARTLLTGPGAEVLAELATESKAGGSLVVMPEGGVEASGADEPRDIADLAVAVFALGHRTDSEAVELLMRLRTRARTLIVVDEARPDSLSPVAHQAALLAFAGNGAGLREAEAVAGVSGEAGWSLQRTISMGWGVEAFVLG